MWLLALLVLIDLLILSNIGTRSTISAPVSKGEQTTIYGTMGCGWTRKQLEYMEKAGKPFKFVDCDKEDCPNMEGFPTIIHTDGEKTVGYSEF
jgi:hypothetical protein